jgi:hypothetical protein
MRLRNTGWQSAETPQIYFQFAKKRAAKGPKFLTIILIFRQQPIFLAENFGHELATLYTRHTYSNIFDSATPQSTQWITNAAYNQRSLQSTPLYTAWIEANTCVALPNAYQRSVRACFLLKSQHPWFKT